MIESNNYIAKENMTPISILCIVRISTLQRWESSFCVIPFFDLSSAIFIPKAGCFIFAGFILCKHNDQPVPIPILCQDFLRHLNGIVLQVGFYFIERTRASILEADLMNLDF